MIARCLHGNELELKPNGMIAHNGCFTCVVLYDGGRRFECEHVTIVNETTSDGHAAHREGKS